MAERKTSARRGPGWGRASSPAEAEAARAEAGKRILAARWIAVVRETTEDAARHAIAALREGGAPIIEVTLTTPGALALIRELSAVGDGPLVGAGTVLDASVAQGAADAGARFLVSPIAPPELVPVGRERGQFVVLGALTPAEIWSAARAGADLVKVFPIASVGGPAFLKLVRGPFPDVALLAAGGIETVAIPDYLAAGAKAVGVARRWPDAEAVREVASAVRGG